MRFFLLGAVILVLVLAVTAWAALAPVSGAVIAPGSVKVDMNRKTVQHQEGGIVGEILVRDGSRVKAGETLIVLKDMRVEAGIEMVQTQLDGEVAKAARLMAEQVWAENVSFPAELLKRKSDARVEELVASGRRPWPFSVAEHGLRFSGGQR